MSSFQTLIKTTLTLVLVTLCFSEFTWAQSPITSAKGIGGYAITAFDRSQGKRGLGGYFDTELVFNEDSTSMFKAHRLILQASAQPHKRILFNTELEFEYGGLVNAGPDNGQIKIEQAWVDFMLSEALVFRTGIVLIPFGRVNILHDSDVRDTTNRPLYAKYIVPTTWMDTGAGFHGIIDTDTLSINYEGYLINGLADTDATASDNISGSKGIREARPGFKSDNNNNMAVVARIGISPSLGTEFGTSYYTGTVDDNNKELVTITGFDAAWKSGPTEWLAEYATVSIKSNAGSGKPSGMNGYYIEGRYHLTGDWLKNSILGEGFRHPVITLFGRVGAIDLDHSVQDSKDITQTTIGVNYRPIETLVYKLEYEMNTEKRGETKNNAVIASVAFGF